MPRTFTFAALADLVLTRDPVKRNQLSMWTVSVVTYLAYDLTMWVQVWLGDVAVFPMTCYAIGCLVVNVAFYACIRKGWCGRRDPGLNVTQLWTGIVALWVGYGLVGPHSAATLTIVGTHIVYAVFMMSQRRVWQLVAGSLAGLALTMAICHWMDPARYPIDRQFIAFLYTATVAGLIARLATLVTQMTEGLRSQRKELARALEKVRELATRDELTQVHNRRHMTELMLREQTQHERSGSPLCVALLDIDFFKSVNDKLGHHAGDEVLRRFAQIARQSLRTSDLLGRWGGEEFVVVFPATPPEQAGVALERMRAVLRDADFSDIGPQLRVSFSAGLVQWPAAEAMERAIERADHAMYRAKTLGRDRVETDSPVTPPETTAVPA